MKYWLFINGRQQGPFSYDELMKIPFTAETPIWYEGLSGWMPAGKAPATASMFGSFANDGEQAAASEATEAPFGSEDPARPTAEAACTAHQSDRTGEASHRRDGVTPCPPTNLGWAIAATICCCIPLGIAAIFMATRVTSRWQNGDYEGARRASESAEWLIILSIVIGLLWAPIGMMVGGF